ncbi:MAG: globin [Bacteroidales bacterium]|nr:globin [Bacteroidales bacterium]
MEISMYDKIGEQNIRKLIHDFYTGIRKDTVLSPLYQGDFDAAQERLTLFMIQYLGGPQTYSEQRGHPALRRRHVQFPVQDETIAHWLGNMKAALDQSEIQPEYKEFLWDYFQNAAEFLRNR